ncbi:hypothetical protein J6590_006585 [Homalodisca vitripennis]|nr:hypothetical protein J6590_006585 [Homalodisca vitripennis]
MHEECEETQFEKTFKRFLVKDRLPLHVCLTDNCLPTARTGERRLLNYIHAVSNFTAFRIDYHRSLTDNCLPTARTGERRLLNYIHAVSNFTAFRIDYHRTSA